MSGSAAILQAKLRIEGRPVLQSTCNRVLDRRNSLKKISPKTPPPPPPPPPPRCSITRIPTSPKLRSPRLPAVKRLGSETSGLTSSVERLNIPKATSSKTLERKKSKRYDEKLKQPVMMMTEAKLLRSYSSSLITEAPGSIAAVRREEMAYQNAQRKMKIAHYGRSKSAKFDSSKNKMVESNVITTTTTSAHQHHQNGDDSVSHEVELEKRCSFITPNSDRIYVAYHDEEWGVPTHDDKKLFELLVLSGAQVGSDWTSILKKRQDFRKAFMEFDAELITGLTEKQMVSVSTSYNIDLSRVRGVVDNANRILEVKKEFGSLDKYIWGFVNMKPICPSYKFGHKMAVKTSKSETISKDLLKRGFRSVGPTVVHSFMQAAGLTNDHLLTCHRHIHCTALANPNIV